MIKYQVNKYIQRLYTDYIQEDQDKNSDHIMLEQTITTKSGQQRTYRKQESIDCIAQTTTLHMP